MRNFVIATSPRLFSVTRSTRGAGPPKGAAHFGRPLGSLATTAATPSASAAGIRGASSGPTGAPARSIGVIFTISLPAVEARTTHGHGTGGNPSGRYRSADFPAATPTARAPMRSQSSEPRRASVPQTSTLTAPPGQLSRCTITVSLSAALAGLTVSVGGWPRSAASAAGCTDTKTRTSATSAATPTRAALKDPPRLDREEGPLHEPGRAPAAAARY